MTESKNCNGDVFREILEKLVWNTENIRWALYEIKIGSEAGEIVKNILFLMNKKGPPDKAAKLLKNTKCLAQYLVNLGFDQNLAAQVLFKLASRDVEH